MFKKIPLFLIVKGGLGNQLFMYSFAFSLAKKTERNLFLVSTWFEKQQRPDFLSDFERDFEIGRYPKVSESSVLFSSRFKRVIFELHRISTRFPRIFSKLGVVNIDEHDLSKKFCLILYGYGHQPDYFIAHKSELVKNFILDKVNAIKVDSYLTSIRSSKKKLIAIHIRRGDSVVAGNFSNVLPINYYERCINTLESSETLFLVFSDDIDWCRKRFKGSNFYFVDEQDPVLSLSIALKCDGYILSASSFSWWMAWLSEALDPIVFFPIEKNFAKTNLGKAFENTPWIGIETIFESYVS